MESPSTEMGLRHELHLKKPINQTLLDRKLDKIGHGFIDNFSYHVFGWSGLIGSHSRRSEMKRDSSRLIKRLNATGGTHD